MARKKTVVDPVEAEFKEAAVAAISAPRQPGEVRGRGQVRELDRLSMSDEEVKPVVMYRDGVEMEVEAENVEANRRQGFLIREE